VVYKIFRDIISKFISSISKLIKNYSFGAEEELYRSVDRLTQGMIAEIVESAPNIMARELSKYSINLPLKYNRQVIDNIYSQISIFKKGSSIYSKADIDRMRKIILTDKYNGLNTSEIQQHLQDSLDISKRRALLVARAESQNLDSSIKEIYFKEVKQDYDLVWSAYDDAREDHKKMDNKKANEDGYFESPWGLIKGPQEIPQQYRWNCRCSIKLIKKEK
jgi:hypothetical protein